MLTETVTDIHLLISRDGALTRIEAHCHELRVNDSTGNWRLIYRIDSDAIVIAEVFSKRTRATPKAVVDVCKRRLKEYDNARK